MRNQVYNENAVRELELYTINDSMIYYRVTQPICKNIAGKISRGKFNTAAAIKAFEYAAEFGAKKYSIEFGSKYKWYQAFPPKDRHEVAKRLLDEYNDYIQELAKEARKS